MNFCLLLIDSWYFILQISPGLSKLSSSVESYYNTGLQHSQAAAGFGNALSDVAKTLQNDKDISEPILKVIHCKYFFKNSSISTVKFRK